MTNEGKVQEIIRHIRGIAMTYPQGMDRIAAEVEAIQTMRNAEALAAETHTATSGTTVLEVRWKPAETTPTTPNSAVPSPSTQQKRGPGRPRKHPRPEDTSK